MTTLAAAILAGTCSPWRSHVFMNPCSHDILYYTKKTRGCSGHTLMTEKRQKIQTFDVIFK